MKASLIGTVFGSDILIIGTCLLTSQPRWKSLMIFDMSKLKNNQIWEKEVFASKRFFMMKETFGKKIVKNSLCANFFWN